MIELLLIAFLVFVLIASVKGLMEIKVKKISTIYINIVEINKTIYFCHIEPMLPIRATLNSKKDFDNSDFDSLFQEALKQEENNTEFDLVIYQSEKNKRSWKNYEKRLDNLDLFKSEIDSKKTLIPYFIYSRLESKIIEEEIYEKPIINPILRLIKTYTSPAGRNQYKATRDYTLRDLSNHRKQLQEKERNEREFKKSTAYQRSIMTQSLRYDILKRDEFRCQICGHSQEDGVKLHVDHIVPVAKGGKTKSSNLRTLCANCNIGKSHKYDYQGIN